MEAFTFAIVVCLVAALASWLRGAKYVHGTAASAPVATEVAEERGPEVPCPGRAEQMTNPSDGGTQDRHRNRHQGLSAHRDAAAQAGVSERTLRYYEEIGADLLQRGTAREAPASTARPRWSGSFRIRELQELMGLNLEEIRRYWRR